MRLRKPQEREAFLARVRENDERERQAKRTHPHPWLGIFDRGGGFVKHQDVPHPPPFEIRMPDGYLPFGTISPVDTPFQPKVTACRVLVFERREINDADRTVRYACVQEAGT